MIKLIALCSDPHMWSLFSVYLARGSGSNMGHTFKVHLVRGSGSNMGPLFKVLLAQVSGPYMCSLFSKCTSRAVVVRSWYRWLAGEAGDPASKIHWARTHPSAKSFLADAEGKAGKRQWDPRWSKSCYDTKLPVRGN